MRILPINFNPIGQKYSPAVLSHKPNNSLLIPLAYDTVSFSANVKKPVLDKEGRQVLTPDVHFITMNTYKRDYTWGKKMNEAVYKVSKMVQDNVDFEEIVAQAENDVKSINNSVLWGKLRDFTVGFPIYKNKRGGEYYDKYLAKVNSAPDNELCPKPGKEYAGANTVEIRKEIDTSIRVTYGYGQLSKHTNLEYMKKAYDTLQAIENPTIDEINTACATIRWLVAQDSPYEKGNDSIGNILIRGIYHAYKVYQSPVKDGKSLDFEAFYRDMDEFIKIYPKLFKVKPFKLDD